MKKIILILFFTITYLSLAQVVQVIELPINTSYDEFSSQTTRISSEMYISSDRDGKQKIYLVKRDGESWSVENSIGREVNSGSENGSVALTPDGQYMIFASYEHNVDGFGRTDLYSARKIEGEWTDIQNLGVAINSEYWDSQPSLSSDGKTLYFVSDRPGGKGGTDIYVSNRTREGWSQAVSVSSLNTDNDEMTPFIAADNSTFTFASNRGGSFGGFDIYFTRLRNGSFSTPSNAGNIINSPQDEYFYVVNPNTDIAYFTSSREGGKGALDIYSAVPNPHPSDDVVFVTGIVKDATDESPLGSEIIITDLASGEETAYLASDDETGEYYVVLQRGKQYSITSESPGYVFYSEKFEIPDKIETKIINKDILLNPIGSGKTRLLIFFDFDKSTLQNQSKPELERVIKFLNRNPELKIELHGHTDDQGATDYNDKLSKDRSNTVKEYLVRGGIENSRINTIGFGESQPLINEKTDSARAKNRRVEMVIVK